MSDNAIDSENSSKPATDRAKPKRERKAKKAKLAKKTSRARRLRTRANGGNASELMKKFDWLPHTTRGFISTLGKEYKVVSEKV
jgi:Protein of unknown function (DUF3489)